MVLFSTTQEVFLAFLVVLVAGGFSLPLEYEVDFPWYSSEEDDDDTERQPRLSLGMASIGYFWPEATMFYRIDPSFNQTERGYIQSAIDAIERVSCVHIKQRTNQTNYVRIVGDEEGCWSYNGMQGGPQLLSLERSKCFVPDFAQNIIIHEVLHAFGLLHNHLAHDRDNYVTVSPIKKEKLFDYEKIPASEITDFDVGFDYNSMPYNKTNSAIDPNKPILIPKNDPNYPIGEFRELGPEDINSLNSMYCKETTNEPTMQTSDSLL